MTSRAFVLVVALPLAFVAAACAKSSNATGAESGAGAAGDQDPCPSDLLAARGKSCAPDGKTCGTSPSGFTHFIMCSRGKWTEMSAPPPPPPPPPPSPSAAH